MPLRQAGLVIDKECHEKFLALLEADTEAKFIESGQALNLFKPVADLETSMLSVARLRVLLSELCCVLVLARGWHGYNVICACREFAKDGTCAHSILVRWMEGDPKIHLAAVSEYAAKNAIATIVGAEQALRKRLLPRCPLLRELPPRTAWSTLQTLVADAKKRAVARKEQKDVSWLFFSCWVELG